MALMLLLAEWARAARRPAPIILTVDHGLRRSSAREAALVAERARALDLQAHVLPWRGRKPASDIERAARDVRYRLMGQWCHANGIGCLFVAHTIRDQAETFVLRLARGSGVDGLAAMAEVSLLPAQGIDAIQVARPLLGVVPGRLRRLLEDRGTTWFEDEMNSDPRFARARLRAAWPALESVGLSTERIAAAARHLARARAALEHDAAELLARASRCTAEYALLDGAQLAVAPEEVGLRSLARLLMRVSGRAHRPRFERLYRLFAAICADGLATGGTLHGCLIRPAARKDAQFGSRTLRISREAPRRAAVPA
jgi:tRNA(Ile)-lysidine synthase